MNIINETSYPLPLAETIITVNHLRLIEAGIIASMLESEELFKKIMASVSREDFIFQNHKAIMAAFERIEYAKLSEMLSDNDRKYAFALGIHEAYPFIDFHNLYTALLEEPSEKIDVDLQELLHYSKAKQYALTQHAEAKGQCTVFFKAINKNGDHTAIYIHNRLCEIQSTNSPVVPHEICDTLSLTMKEFMPLMADTKNNPSSINPCDQEPLGEVSITININIEEIQSRERLIAWATENNIDEEVFPRMKEGLSRLSMVELENLGLKELPPELLKLFLVSLNIKNNQITHLPEGKWLKTFFWSLSACNNLLSHLPESLYKATSLVFLCLHGNRFESLPEEIGNLTKLKTFSISNNPIHTLPITLNNLMDLEQLDIENTLVDEISIELLKLPKLRKISFDDKLFPFIVQHINLLHNIDTINLTHSNYKVNDEIIRRLGLIDDEESWMAEKDYQGHGCILLSGPKVEEKED